MQWGSRPAWARWLAMVYAIGFIQATGVPAYFLAVGGLGAYNPAPIPVQLLFHALLLLDPLVAVLIIYARPVGPLLGAAVMLADAVANWWIQWSDVLAHPAAYLRPVGLLAITLFGVLVLATALPLRSALTSTRDINEDEQQRTETHAAGRSLSRRDGPRRAERAPRPNL